MCARVCGTVHAIHFRRGREDLKAAHQRINQMLADYGDVVPRREYEQLQTAYEVGYMLLDQRNNINIPFVVFGK